MCGICGIIGNHIERATVERMVAAQYHRGPDGSGIYIDNTLGVGLGHTRLRILDLTDDARQPMWSNDRRYAIVFNGEIFNYLELKKELPDYDFRSSGDTEVILAAYKRWGKDCVSKFVGIFAFALWDCVTRELFCARDHIGVKPFYYTTLGGAFMFASEIKALLEAGVPAKVNEEILCSYLCEGVYDHNEETFFDSIWALEPGSWLTVKEGNIVQRTVYWDLASIVRRLVEEPVVMVEPEEKLNSLLDEAVRLQLRGEVPMGIHLTGGLDSSSLLSRITDIKNDSNLLFAFTGAYDDPQYDEVQFALSAASGSPIIKHCTTRLRSDEFWEIASSVQHAQEQPFGGLATMVYWKMEQEVKASGIKVILEGQGGDELFGGYAYYLGDYLADLQAKGSNSEELSIYRNCCGEALFERLLANTSTGLPVHQDGTTHLAPECVDPTFRSTRFKKTSFVLPSTSRLTNARFRDIRHTKLPRVLRFNDRMSMAFGIELRVPFLDWRLVEFSFALSPASFFEAGLSKAILRRAMAGNLPEAICLAPKRSVVTPQREWFAGPLKAEIINRIKHSEAGLRGYLNTRQMLKRFEEFCQKEDSSNSFFIWQWLNLDLWLSTFSPT